MDNPEKVSTIIQSDPTDFIRENFPDLKVRSCDGKTCIELTVLEPGSAGCTIPILSRTSPTTGYYCLRTKDGKEVTQKDLIGPISAFSPTGALAPRNSSTSRLFGWSIKISVGWLWIRITITF